MKHAAVIIFLILICAYITFDQYIEIKVTVPHQQITTAPGSFLTLNSSDYFTGFIENHDLNIRSGPALNITREGNKYHLEISKKLRGYRIQLELSAKNQLDQKSVTIEISTNFIGDIYDVALANSASCLKDDFGIFCWGDNTFDESGNVPSYFTKDAQLFGRGNHFCGYENKRLICWGDISADIKLREPSNISVGEGGVCYVDDGRLYCLSSGSGYEISRNIPIETPKITAIAVGGFHACLLDHSQRVSCWGKSGSAQVDVPDDLIYPKKLISGYTFSCVLDAGEIKCWGGRGFSANQPKLGQIIDIAANGDRLCAQNDQGWHCWLINNKYTDRNKKSFYSDYDHITIGRSAICLINKNKLECDDLVYEVPYAVVSPKTLKQSGHSVCFLDQGKVNCFGSKAKYFNKYINLTENQYATDFDFYSSSNKACIKYNSGKARCIDFSRGGVDRSFDTSPSAFDVHNSACALIDGQAECWGKNSLNNKFPPPILAQPQKISVTGTDSSVFACASDKNGLACWGKNNASQLNIPILSNLVDFDLFAEAGCAINSREMACWGNRLFLPKKFGRVFHNALSVSIQGQSICVNDNGNPKCWGGRKNHKVPSYLTSVSELKTGMSQSCAIDSGGVTCWGDRYFRYGIEPSM
jgi:hypothetical protein